MEALFLDSKRMEGGTANICLPISHLVVKLKVPCSKPFLVHGCQILFFYGQDINKLSSDFTQLVCRQTNVIDSINMVYCVFSPFAIAIIIKKKKPNEINPYAHTYGVLG